MTHTTHDGLEASGSNRNDAVSGLDRRTLDTIFRHPLAHGLSWREVVTLLTAIGDAEEKHNGEFLFSLGDERLSMKKPHNKDLTGPDVIDLRHFLTRAGWSPDAAPASEIGHDVETPTVVIVIDHAGARVYRIDRSAEDGRGLSAFDPKHLLHHVERKSRDTDRDETYPEDERFFEVVAEAVSSAGEIVVIGHGKGQSNEADHLSAYLKTHHKLIYDRIVREIVADLPHLTTPELLEIGRHALG